MSFLFPTPFLGWNSIYRGPVNHLFFGLQGSGSTAKVRSLVSRGGRVYHGHPIKGDMAEVVEKVGYPYFLPRKFLVRGDYLFIAGVYTTNGTNLTVRVYRSLLTDLHDFELCNTGFTATNEDVGGIAANDSYIVVLGRRGNISISSDGGGTWAIDTISPSSGMTAHALVVGSTGIWVAGVSSSGFVRTVSGDPANAWTARSFTGATGSYTVWGLAVGSTAFVASTTNGQIATAPSNSGSGATWTLRTTPADTVGANLNTAVSDGASTFLLHGNIRPVDGVNPAFLRSADSGATWTSPADGSRPWDAGSGEIATTLQAEHVDGVFHSYFNDEGHRCSISEDGLSWADVPNNLAAFGISATNKLFVPLTAAS